ncbi:MAG TPA: cardiolipin synthase [Kofleriaceae bacterium]|nr:cardiolipin synthase [Kofleriaceae bacterium]
MPAWIYDPLLLTVAALAWALIMAVHIVLQRRPAASTISWLLVLAFLPVLGFLIYRLIGPLRLERKKLRRAAGRRLVRDTLGALADLEAQSPEDLQLALVPIGVGEQAPMRASQVDLFFDGASTYAAMAEAIAAARHHIHLEYYIWEPDRIGHRMRDLLVDRARAGVKVRMIVDGTGSNNLRRRFLRPLRDAGVEVAWFNPLTFRSLRSRRADFRTHRKILVCDGRVGFTGGMNIVDSHSAELSDDYWRDTHLRIEGAAVWAMQRVFCEDWVFVSGAMPPCVEELVPADDPSAPHIVQIVSSGPDAGGFAIHKAYFTAINEARERVWITTPYFVPDEPMLAAMTAAALRGIDVRILLPARGDSKLIDLAARSYFPELLAAGVAIWEYQARFIHAKTMVIDDDVGIVATANMDNRSFRLNFEIAAVLYGEQPAARLAHQYMTDLGDSRQVAATDLDRLSFARRFGQAGARLFSPLL